MHHHHRVNGDYHRSFAIGVGLNIAFVIIEAIYGVLADSMALIADAGHNLSDVLSLLLAWGATALARYQPTRRHTYGFRRATLIAAVVSSVMLFTALGAIMWEAVQRFTAAPEVDGVTVMVVAAIGFVINTLTALLFASGQRHDLNIRGAFLHMAADAAVSLGVVVAGGLILFTGWLWLDPLVSLLIALVILAGAWGLLRDSLLLSLDAVPRHIDPEAVEAYLLGLAGVESLHDLHIWAMSTHEFALTAHLSCATGIDTDALLQQAANGLQQGFGISHSTLQLEHADSALCKLAAPGSL